jgi:hypothetical protein
LSSPDILGLLLENNLAELSQGGEPENGLGTVIPGSTLRVAPE